VTLSLLALAWQMHRAGLKSLAGLLVLALGVQVGLGVSNVLYHLPLATAVAHNAGGAALMLTMTLINYRVRLLYATSRRHAPSFWQHAHVLLHLGPHR
jgi:cytochrome c oxidase assembly protein subunit 15